MKVRALTGLSVVSALASSACCWLPAVMVGLGLSAMGVGAFLEQFRVAFLVVAAGLLGLGFYLNDFRRSSSGAAGGAAATCAPDGACETPGPGRTLRRTNRIMMGLSAVLVAAFAFFPGPVEALLDMRSLSAEAMAESGPAWSLGIQGMTCAGCEVAVEDQLSRVPGVVAAAVSYDQARATVVVDKTEPPTRMALEAAVGRAGYTLASVDTAGATASLAAPALLAVAPASSAAPAPVAAAPVAQEVPALSGHWVTEVEDEDGQPMTITMDIGLLHDRWVGEFDVPKYGVADYPIEVRRPADPVDLLFTAIGMGFIGSIGSDGTLTGRADAQDSTDDPIVFTRTGPVQLSEDLLQLDAAAQDGSLLQVLSGNGSELRERFNADAQKTRFLMLLSPT